MRSFSLFVLTGILAISSFSGVSAQELCGGPGDLRCKENVSCSSNDHADDALGYCSPKHLECTTLNRKSCPIGFECSPGALVTHGKGPKGLCVLAEQLPRTRLAEYVADCCNNVAFNTQLKFPDACLVYPTDTDERASCGLFLDVADKRSSFVPTPEQIDTCCASASQSGGKFSSQLCHGFGAETDSLCAPYVDQNDSGAQQRRLPRSAAPRSSHEKAAAIAKKTEEAEADSADDVPASDCSFQGTHAQCLRYFTNCYWWVGKKSPIGICLHRK